MGKSGFKFTSDRDALEEALADLGGGNFLKLKEGKNVLRILPPYDDSGLWFYESYLHYGFKNEGKTIAVPCMGDGCYICKRLNELASEGGEGAKLARRYGTRTKYYANVLDRDSGGGVKIWGFSRKVLQSLKAYWMDVDDGCEFDHPEDGRDIIVERSGTGLDTRYEVRIRPKSTLAIEAGEDAPELFNLKDTVEKEFSKDELKRIWTETFEGAGEEEVIAKKKKNDDVEDDEDDEEETPKKKRVIEDDDEDGDAPKKKVVEEDDDEDEEEETPKKKKVVEEDEEEKKPVSRRDKKRRR